jgi:chromosome segregation ATPase
METELRKKQLDNQISTSISEAARLEELIKALNETLGQKQSESESKIAELSTSVENKKREVISIENIVATKNVEATSAQGKLNDVKKDIELETADWVEAVNKKEAVEKEIKEARESLEKVRERNSLEEGEGIAELKKQKQVLKLAIEDTKEALVLLEREVSKLNFIKDEAEKAAHETGERNSELEKVEKGLRNKITAYKTNVETLEKKELELTTRVKEAEVKVESDEARQVLAEEKRVVAEAELEVAQKTLLSNIARFDTMEEQLNSRAEKLKVAYDKAGITWPNL